MDKLRADFEDAWVADNSSTPEEADIRREALKKIWHINENGEGTYFDSFVMWAWKWWQASRASIVVELPGTDNYWNGTSGHEIFNHRQFAADSCDALRDIGLSIKGE